MLLSPSTEGTATIRASGPAFIRGFARRIEEGLLRGSSERRNRYVVTEAGPDRLAFRATGWLTAFNVGLNDVDVRLSPAGVAHYRIRYSRWAGYGLAAGAGFALFFIAFLLMFDLRTYIAEHSGPEYLGLSPDQNVAIAWSMAVFWGLVWPWILIAAHKRPLRRLMEQLIAEIDAAARQNT